MNPTTFNRLIENLTQYFDSADCVDLRASDSIVIYGWRHDDFKLHIEYFDGLPTEHQRLVMQAKINNAVSVLDDHFKDIPIEVKSYVDPYELNGVRRSDFY